MVIETFPIMHDYKWRRLRMQGLSIPECPETIPWQLVQPHEAQAQTNHGQSLSRLAERGGLAPSEAVAVLEDRQWQPMSPIRAMYRLIEIIGANDGH